MKAVIQAIPTYNMSVFKLPQKLCKEINGLMHKFWWGYRYFEGPLDELGEDGVLKELRRLRVPRSGSLQSSPSS